MCTCEGTTSSPLFSRLEQAIISTVLEECTNALTIYIYTLNSLWKNNNTNFLDYIIPGIDNLGPSGIAILNEDVRAAIKKLEDQATYKKLQRDSLFVEKLMKRLKEQIQRENSFDVLSYEINNSNIREKEENDLIRRSIEMNDIILQLRNNVKCETVSNKQEYERLIVKMHEVKNEKEELTRTSFIKLNYLNASEKAKSEQDGFRCKIELEQLENRLKKYQISKINQIRVTNEILNFLLQNTQIIRRNTDTWTKRHDEEMRDYEQKILVTREEISIHRAVLTEFIKEYDTKQEFIDSYLAEKEIIRKQQEHKENQKKCAIKIQAWWRGVMVRHKLGPYRPEEKKKKRSTKTKK